MGRVSCKFYSYIACLVVAAAALLLIKIFYKVPNRGFFCDDDTIRYPKLSESISSLQIFLICSITPAFFFLGVELYQVLAITSADVSCHTVSRVLGVRLGQQYASFILGVILNEITVLVGKSSLGRLRPHFLAVCQPEAQVCSSDQDEHIFITQYECTGDATTVAEARESFPSGHAALSFYTAIYVSAFLQHRLRWKSTRAPRYLLQAVLVILAWLLALSRLHDYMHHPSDVAAGILIGSFWAVLTTTLVIDMDKTINYPNYPHEKEESTPFNPHYMTQKLV